MISILMPSFEYGHFISDALDSVLDQTADLELVIIDGASSDDTVKLLTERSTNDPRLRWTSEPDTGQSDALNKAFQLSQGEIIGWLNADEFYLEGTLAAVLKIFESMPEVDVVYGDAIFVDESGRYLRTVAHHRYKSYILRHGGCFIPTCSTFIRRSALEGFTWDTQLSTLMDWDMFMFLDAGGAVFEHYSQPLGAYRVHGAQVTAVPLPSGSEQHERVRVRYGVRRGRFTRFFGYQSARGVRRVLKLRPGGGIWKERAERHNAGKDLKWFRETNREVETS